MQALVAKTVTDARRVCKTYKPDFAACFRQAEPLQAFVWIVKDFATKGNPNGAALFSS